MNDKKKALIASVSASSIGMMWLVVSAVLFAGMIFDVGDTSNSIFAAAKTVALAKVGFDASQVDFQTLAYTVKTKVQLIMTIQPLVAVVMAFATGPLAKRVSKKLLLMVAMVCAAIAAVIYSTFSFSGSYALLYVGAVMGGIVSGITGSIPNALVYKYADSFQERGKLSGYNNAFLQGGALVMSTLGGVLASRFGWHAAYYLWYLSIPALLIVSIICPPDKPEKAASGAPKASLKDIPAHVWLMCLHFMLFFVCCYTFSVYCSRFVAEAMPESTSASSFAGIATALLTISAVCSSALYSKYAQKLGRFFMPFFCLCLAIGYILTALFPSNIVMIFIAGILVGAGKGASIPYCISHATAISPKPLMATVIAFLMGSMSFGMFISQYVIEKGLAKLIRPEVNNYAIFVATAIVAVAAMISGAALYWKGDATEKKA